MISNQNDTAQIIISTDSIEINVISLINNNDYSIKEIKAKEPLPFSIYYKLIFSIISILILLLIIVWMFSKRKIDNQLKNNFNKNIHPYVIAKNKIELLKLKKPKSQKEAGTFYSDLSFIVKEFIENQFFIKTIEMTTNEIKKNKNMIGFNKNEINEIIKVLERADLTKFAKVFPLENQLKSDLNVIQDFLDNQKIDL